MMDLMSHINYSGEDLALRDMFLSFLDGVTLSRQATTIHLILMNDMSPSTRSLRASGPSDPKKQPRII
jgi:hypothetical protein